ncbi:hypothetical protein Dimus_026673, partial [Dionaea muscipula]
MDYLFNLVSTSRCMVHGREVDFHEEDSEMRELKEKVVKLGEQLELQKSEEWLRTSEFFQFVGQDMDTSGSEHSQSNDDTTYKYTRKIRRRNSKRARSGSGH